jgi:4-amino-4-deoxy-L-arabinose transferase-like glycosyltransferase
MLKAPEGKIITVVILILSFFLIFLERFHTYHEPLERDITTYAVIGHELLRGRLLYSDLWDHKPPAIYATFAFAELIFGYGVVAIFWLNLIAALLTLGGIYQAGKWVGGEEGGLWAALFWAVISSDLYLEANQPNTEVFLNSFLTLAFVCWLHLEKGEKNTSAVIMIGFFSLLASFYKQTAVLTTILLAVVHILLADNKKERITALRQTLSIASILAVGWLGLSAYFLWNHRLDDFLSDIFSYNYSYVSFHSMFVGNFSEKISQLDFGAHFGEFLVPLLLVGCAGAWSQRKSRTRVWGFWLAYLIGSEIQVFFSGRFYPHYYQLLLPPLVLGAAWGSIQIKNFYGYKITPPKWISGFLLLFVLVFHEIPFYGISATEWSQKKYGDIFIQSEELAGTINRILKPGETFYEWGNETGLYFTTKSSPPSGLFYSFPFFTPPMGRALSEKVILDLEAHKPELFIFSRRYMPDGWLGLPLISWLREHYRLMPGSNPNGNFLLFMRKGGELEKRASEGFQKIPPV